MPYKNITELPEGVKVLPAGGQRLWMTAYNFADKNKDRFKTTAARAQYAWGVVKKVYKKNTEGKWVKKKKMSGITNDEFTMSMPTDPPGWARLYFLISPEEWETLSDERKQEFIDQIPAMLASIATKLADFSIDLISYDTVEEPKAEDQLDQLNWIQQDIRNLWDRLWSDKEQTDLAFETINQRIDDLMALFVGVKRVAAGEVSSDLAAEKLLDLNKSLLEETDIEKQINWMREDISAIWSQIYNNNDLTEDQIEAINKRIDDLIVIFTGIKRLAAGTPKTDEQRAIDHFFDGDKEEWDKLTAEEKKKYIAKLPEPGTKRKNMITTNVRCSDSEIKWEKSGDFLKITGTLISEGTWTGLDGQTVFYPRTIFPEAAPSILNGAIKRGHKADENAVIGFVTASRSLDMSIEIEGIIFEKQSIEDVIMGNVNGLSMEADVHAEMDKGKGVYIATSLDLLKATLVENPACDSCRIGTVASVALDKGQEKKKEKKKMSTNLEYMLYAKPTTTEFFEFIETNLKEAEVEDAAIGKMLAVLRKVVTVPRPIPAVEPNAELTKEPDKVLQAEVERLQGELDTAKAALTAKEDEVKSTLEEKDNAISTLSSSLEAIKEAEITTLLGKIKDIDKDFDEKELLEGVECADVRKKLLSGYLASLVKLSTKSFTVDSSSSLEKRVSSFLEMTGITDVKSFIEGK